MSAPGKWERYEHVASSYHNCWHVELMFIKFNKDYNRYSAKDIYWIDELIYAPYMYLGCTKL